MRTRARQILTGFAVAGLAALGVAGPAAISSADPIPSYTATFTPGQTDGLRPVAGSVTFTPGPGVLLNAQGTVTGLAANTAFVTVPYYGPGCVPAPGVTAFPSGSFTTDSTGTAAFSVTENPKGINPLGQLSVDQIGSVSIRQVVVNGISVPGLPLGTPTIPNVAATEACYSGASAAASEE